jgi:very-short-patch-repair endonuclease
MDADLEVAAIARRHHGAVARVQALACGMTDGMIRSRHRTGRWERSRAGVYVFAGVPPSHRQSVLVALLAAGAGAVASHLTAASLWGLRFPEPDAIHLTGRQVRLEGVVGHRTSTLDPVDVTVLGAIPILSAARTIVSCSGTVGLERLGEIVDDALRRRLVTLADLRSCHERIATGPGRRPTVALRQVLAQRVVGYQPGDSQPEADLVRVLANAGLPAPVLGHRVRIGTWRYRLDIAWPEAMLGLEHDGWDTHRTFTAFHGDRQRLRRLTAAGWTILPVTAKTRLDELIADVDNLLSVRAAVA